MKAMGFEPEDYEGEPDMEVWPENWAAFRIFSRLSTQWNVSAGGGITGLVYPALYPLIDRTATTDQEWDDLLNDVQAMERAALPLLNKKD